VRAGQRYRPTRKRVADAAASLSNVARFGRDGFLPTRIFIQVRLDRLATMSVRRSAWAGFHQLGPAFHRPPEVRDKLICEFLRDLGRPHR
jgi:hypothetical protein